MNFDVRPLLAGACVAIGFGAQNIIKAHGARGNIGEDQYGDDAQHIRQNRRVVIRVEQLAASRHVLEQQHYLVVCFSAGSALGMGTRGIISGRIAVL
jgi:hypothetical protein